MKLVAKIFNWITIVSAILAIIFILIFAISLGISVGKNEEERLLIGLVSFISLAILIVPCLIPLIVCLLSNHQLKKAKTRKDLKVMGVITLIFGNLISGIMMLCLEDSDLVKEENKTV